MTLLGTPTVDTWIKNPEWILSMSGARGLWSVMGAERANKDDFWIEVNGDNWAIDVLPDGTAITYCLTK